MDALQWKLGDGADQWFKGQKTHLRRNLAEKVRGIGQPRDRAEAVAAVASRYMAIGSHGEAIDLIRSSSLFEKAWVLKEIAAAYDAYMQETGNLVDVPLLVLVKDMKQAPQEKKP